MRTVIALGLALGVGIGGALVWVAIAYFYNVELNWVAWILGCAVGCTIAGHVDKGSVILGAAAAIITLASIASGKYIAVQIIIDQDMSTAVDEEMARLNDPVEIRYVLAEQEVGRMEEAGEPVLWPKGLEPEEKTAPEDYPVGVWQRAQSKWDALTADEQSDYRQSLAAEIRAWAQVLADTEKREWTNEILFGRDLRTIILSAIFAFFIGTMGSRKKDKPSDTILDDEPTE